MRACAYARTPELEIVEQCFYLSNKTKPPHTQRRSVDLGCDGQKRKPSFFWAYYTLVV